MADAEKVPTKEEKKKKTVGLVGAVKCARTTDLFKQSASDNEASDEEVEPLQGSRERSRNMSRFRVIYSDI